ncbi:MAG: hypothetical protein AAGL24_07825 [Pseudomonadota bacterium]
MKIFQVAFEDHTSKFTIAQLGLRGVVNDTSGTVSGVISDLLWAEDPAHPPTVNASGDRPEG